MSAIDQAIRESVEQFVQEMTALIRRAALESVSVALGQAGAPGRGGRRGVVRAPGARQNGKRTAAELEGQGRALVALIKETPGIRADQLAEALGLITRDVALPIKKLLSDKVVHKKGQKRATAYYLGRGK